MKMVADFLWTHLTWPCKGSIFTVWVFFFCEVTYFIWKCDLIIIVDSYSVVSFIPKAHFLFNERPVLPLTGKGWTRRGRCCKIWLIVTFFFSPLKDCGINTTQWHLPFYFHIRISREFIERLDMDKEEIMTVILD